MAYNQAYILLAVQSLCPSLVAGTDYELADVDGVNQISVWNNTTVTQPTPSQIASVDTDALLAAQLTILPQDLMAQFTSSDIGKIQSAIGSSVSMWQLWNSMLAQRDPMVVSASRFTSGWNALVSVLTQSRMNQIATALGATSLVVGGS